MIIKCRIPTANCLAGWVLLGKIFGILVILSIDKIWLLPNFLLSREVKVNLRVKGRTWRRLWSKYTIWNSERIIFYLCEMQWVFSQMLYMFWLHKKVRANTSFHIKHTLNSTIEDSLAPCERLILESNGDNLQGGSIARKWVVRYEHLGMPSSHGVSAQPGQVRGWSQILTWCCRGQAQEAAWDYSLLRHLLLSLQKALRVLTCLKSFI